MLKKYLSNDKATCFLVILFTVLQSAFGAGYAIIFKELINFAEQVKLGSMSINNLYIIIALLFIWILSNVLFDFLRRHFRAKFLITMDRQVKVDYLNLLLNTKLKNYIEKDSGHYLSRFINDLPTIINDYIFQFFNLILYITESFFIIVTAFYLSWFLALVFLVLSTIIVIYTTFFNNKFNKIRKEMSKASSDYTSNLKSLLQGFHIIKFNNSISSTRKKFLKFLEKPLKVTKQWWSLEAIYSPSASLLTFLLTFSAIVVSSVFYMNGLFTIGVLSAAIYVSSRVFNPISNTFEQITYIKSNISLIKEVYDEFESSPSKDEDIVGKIESIEFKNLSFSYENKEIIKDFSLELPMNKKILIIGESGVGKSTFLKLLTGQLNFTGQLNINGSPITDIKESELYRCIYFMDQDSYLFKDSLRNNIDVSGENTDDTILKILEQVDLTSFLNDKNLDSIIDEEVTEVSGGEKQKICLARALIGKHQVLLLDEITSSLDTESTKKIEETILNIKDTTILYICHKVTKETIDNFDYILKFSENQKIEIIKSSEFSIV